MSFVKDFSEHFRSYRHDVTEKSRQYASGLMQGGFRKNMDRMAEVVPDSKSRNLQQFLTHSKWDARTVIDHVARETNEHLGDAQRAGFLIDESGFAKQGPMSVGVARQWLGRLGKVDNGQVAVFGVLANKRLSVPVDVRLYLPKKWTGDPERCDKAGIPEDERTFRTKDKLALEIVAHARQTACDSAGWEQMVDTEKARNFVSRWIGWGSASSWTCIRISGFILMFPNHIYLKRRGEAGNLPAIGSTQRALR